MTPVAIFSTCRSESKQPRSWAYRHKHDHRYGQDHDEHSDCHVTAMEDTANYDSSSSGGEGEGEGSSGDQELYLDDFEEEGPKMRTTREWKPR